MPLPTPTLDDRSYQQLRDELVRRIPVYNREWTDHNPTDPGITLLELFAFLGENLLYRFNQIPETTRLAFLQLLQIPLRPALPARAIVTAGTRAADGVLVPLGAEARAGEVPFQWLTEVRVWPLECLAVARATSAAPSPGPSADAALEIIAARGMSSTETPQHYKPVRLAADPSLPDAAAVDLDATVDRTLWIAVLRTPDTDLSKLWGGTISFGFAPEDDTPAAIADVGPCPDASLAGGASTSAGVADVVWQVSTTQWDAARKATSYRAITVASDTTGGLRRPGVVQLRLPARAGDVGVPAAATGPFAGSGDLPPLLEDPKESARILFWVRAFRSDGTRLGKVMWVGVNAGEVQQQRAAKPEFLGTGTGQPRQQVRLVHAPVVAASLVLEVEDADGWHRWTEVDSLHASGEDDRHFTLDREAGIVEFGNGVRGATPQIGQRVRARQYLYGGGVAGNVPAKAIRKVDGVTGLKDVTNPLRARGGAASEDIAEALERIPSEFRRHDRAVTASDFRELARMTPDAEVGRAECLPLFRPDHPTDTFAGVVSVVVWPREDARRPDAPMPDATTLRAVCRWLDARRLVTTELYVIPPTYRRVSVSVGLHTKPGYGPEAVREWVSRVLRQYLSPLPPFGPDGEGWPLGRVVRARELEAAALQVEGIEYLEPLQLRDGDTAAVVTEVALARWEVPQLVSLTVTEGVTLAPGTAPQPRVPAGVPVPIPVPPEQC